MLERSLARVYPVTHTYFHSICQAFRIKRINSYIRESHASLGDLHRRDRQVFQSLLPKSSTEKKKKVSVLQLWGAVPVKNMACVGTCGCFSSHAGPLLSFFICFFGRIGKACGQKRVCAWTYAKMCDRSSDTCVRRTLFSHLTPKHKCQRGSRAGRSVIIKTRLQIKHKFW